MLVTLLVIAGLTAAPDAMSSSADDQDACRIGAISPEEYRTIAAEVAAMPPIDRTPRSRLNADGLAAALRERLEPVLGGRVSTDQQIAAMHQMVEQIPIIG